jgi:hypothetical protein
MRKIAKIIVNTLKGHNATGDLIRAMVNATTEASNIYYGMDEKAEIYAMVIHELNGEFNPLAEVNVF